MSETKAAAGRVRCNARLGVPCALADRSSLAVPNRTPVIPAASIARRNGSLTKQYEAEKGSELFDRLKQRALEEESARQ